MDNGRRIITEDLRPLMYAVNPYGADHQSSEHDPSYSPDSYEIPQYKQRANEISLSNPQADDELNEAKVEYALVTQLLQDPHPGVDGDDASVLDDPFWFQVLHPIS